MKQKTLKNKLSLNKKTVADLNVVELNAVKGGVTEGTCESKAEICFTEPITVCGCPTNGQASCPPYC